MTRSASNPFESAPAADTSGPRSDQPVSRELENSSCIAGDSEVHSRPQLNFFAPPGLLQVSQQRYELQDTGAGCQFCANECRNTAPQWGYALHFLWVDLWHLACRKVQGGVYKPSETGCRPSIAGDQN
jgi:hypothetical protein